MRKGKKFISAALGFALVFQSFAGIGPVAVAATGDVDIYRRELSVICIIEF